MGDRLGAGALPARRRLRPDPRLRALPPAETGGRRVNDAALSPAGRWILRVFFALVVLFLYAPIVILLIFSFNKSAIPAFPLSGFTFHWYREFLSNSDLRNALETSAIVATFSSAGAVVLGILASLALTRRRFSGQSAVSALLLSPLVIPYVVFGISLLLLFHTVGVPRSILTVVIGHIVISLPYTILVLVPRLDQIDASLEEAAFDLGASRMRTFRSITLPLILPAVVSAFLIAFTTSFDEYAVASFVVGSRITFPIYLYSALRFPSQLPQVIAVAVVVLVLSLTVVIAAEVGRRIAERRLGAQ
ncbi:MAG: ABC transporter permease [Actinobacteria bacterium]|nr:MAG: ABC transporter permease [Actinomycetota bacterium]